MPKPVAVPVTTILLVVPYWPDNIAERGANQVLVTTEMPSVATIEASEKIFVVAIVPTTIASKENNTRVLEAYNTTERKWASPRDIGMASKLLDVNFVHQLFGQAEINDPSHMLTNVEMI